MSEQEFTKVDGFKEYVGGISNDEVYVLLAALENLQQSQNELFPEPKARLKEMYGIIILEFHERDVSWRDFQYD